MEIFAHRGLVPEDGAQLENSMGALENAIRGGFSIETDFRYGRDREILVFHDADLRRIFGREERTERIDPRGLRRLYDSRSSRPEPCDPTLEALLSWRCFESSGGGKSILINIKEHDDVSFTLAVCDVVQRMGREDSTWLFDMEQSLIPEIHEKFPSVRLLGRFSHLAGEGIEDLRALGTCIQGVWFDDYDGRLREQAEDLASELRLPLFFVSPELHRDTHPDGAGGVKRVQDIWDDVIQNRAFVAICTDYPGEFRRRLCDSSGER